MWEPTVVAIIRYTPPDNSVLTDQAIHPITVGHSQIHPESTYR